MAVQFHHLVLQEGALNLESNTPPHEQHLLAPTVRWWRATTAFGAGVLVSRLHGGAGMLQREHEFPSDKDTDFEMSTHARHFYEAGPPFLDRHPFWAATFVNRVHQPGGTGHPAHRIAPAIYTWLIKSRIYKLYGELRFLEMQLRTQPELDMSTFRKELDAIEHRVNHTCACQWRSPAICTSCAATH